MPGRGSLFFEQRSSLKSSVIVRSIVLQRFKKSLADAPVIKVGKYDYFVHPMTDGIPRADPEVLDEVVKEMLRIGSFDCDVILAPEAMGIPIAVPLSLELRIPYSVIRKRGYSLPGEVRVDQQTGYSKGAMFVNGLSRGDRVAIVDDVLSTGGTLRAVVLALRSIGVEIVDVLVAVEKGNAKERLEAELGIGIKTLVKVEVRDGRLVVLT